MSANPVLNDLSRCPEPYDFRWLLECFFKTWSQIYQYIANFARNRVAQFNSSVFSRSRSSFSVQNESKQDVPTCSIGYTVQQVGEFSSCLLLFAIHAPMCVKFGAKLTRNFVVGCYLTQIVVLSFAIPFCTYLGLKLIEGVLPDLIQRASFLMIATLISAFVGYVYLALANSFWLLYKRNFLYDLRYKLSGSFVLNKKVQDDDALPIVVTLGFIHLFSEPLYLATVCYYYINFESFYALESASLLQMFKWLFIIFEYIAPFICCFMSRVIPTMTMILSGSIREHVKCHLTSKIDLLLSQAYTNSEKFRSRNSKLDSYSLSIVEDCLADNLDADWPVPQIVENRHQINDASHKMRGPASDRIISSSKPSALLADQESDQCMNHLVLYHYKQIIKNLSSLKGVICAYDREFAMFMILMVCLTTFQLTQVIALSLVHSRLTPTTKQSLESFQFKDLSLREITSPIHLTAILRVLSHIAIHSYIFINLDRLPDELIRLRRRLFKLNLRNRQSPTRASSSGLEDISLDWNLYDQFVRTSQSCNFIFTGDTYMSKRVLLMILSQEISFIVLFLQLMDVYMLSV